MICLIGSCAALRMILRPICWSSLSSLIPSEAIWLAALNSAIPPPHTTPSSIAARVAFSASSTRSFFSFSSTSEAAPSLITATPPASLAIRSRSLSFS